MTHITILRVYDYSLWEAKRGGVTYDCGSYRKAKACALKLYADADSPARLEVADLSNDIHHIITEK